MSKRIPAAVRVAREGTRRRNAAARLAHPRPALTLVPSLPVEAHKHSFRKPAAKYNLAADARRCSCGATRTLLAA